MSDQESPKITLKAGNGYDAPWLTIPFGNSQQALAVLADVRDSKLLDAIVETATLFKAVNSAGPITAPQQAPAQNVTQGPWGQPQQAAPAQQQAPVNNAPAQHPEGTQCDACGSVLQYKVVNRKKDGKQFKFWACPNNTAQGDGHTSVFA